MPCCDVELSQLQLALKYEKGQAAIEGTGQRRVQPLASSYTVECYV